MYDWIAKYWLEAIFSGFLAGLGWLIKVLWTRQQEHIQRVQNKQEAMEKGIQALLRDRIVGSYYHYAEIGCITLHGLESTEKMYTEYHNLGGNGTVTKLMEDMRELPVKDRADPIDTPCTLCSKNSNRDDSE